MTLRHPRTAIFQGASAETLREAIDALDTVEPASPAGAAEIAIMRRELEEELRSIESTQGSLFG